MTSNGCFLAGRARFSGRSLIGVLVTTACLLDVSYLQAFEGRIDATLKRGGDVQTWHYTVGTNCLRIERGETNRPYAKNLIARDTGNITLLFPHNRSFVRLKPTTGNAAIPPLKTPAFPVPPTGIGPQTQLPSAMPASSDAGPTNLPGLSSPIVKPHISGGFSMPAFPMMAVPEEALELKATGETTNLLGYACTRYEIKQRDEVTEIWATDKLLPFQAWLPTQPSRFGPQMLEEKWGGVLQAKKLFPLLAVWKFENGPEQLRFVVTSIKPQRVKDPDATLFQPPSDYQEIEPLPF